MHYRMDCKVFSAREGFVFVLNEIPIGKEKTVMKNQFIALLTLALLALPMMAKAADGPNAMLYGTINTTLENATASTPTAGEGYSARWRLVSNSTNFGIKGAEDLGNDMKALFQMEVAVSIPEGALSATLRNSKVGLSGSFGEFNIANWDTGFKSATTFMEPFYGAGVGQLASITDTAHNKGIASTSNFYLRKNTLFQYISPNFAGLVGKIYYSPKGSAANAMDYLMGLALNFNQGPITVNAAYETHEEYVTGQTDTGMKFAAGYKLFDTTDINASYTSLSYKTKAPEATDKKSTIAFSLIHRMGDFAIRAAYGMAGTLSNSVTGEVADSGASMLIAGGSYSVSKRTDLYAIYASINNAAAAGYNFAQNQVNGTSATPGLLGSDPTSIGIGVRHTF